MLTPRDRPSLRLTDLLTLAVATVVKPARQGCAALPMGKPPKLLPQQSALMNPPDTVARLMITVARGVNLNLANALGAPSISVGTCGSTGTSFAVAEFISELVGITTTV